MILTAFHGIGAYRGQHNPLALNKALNTALSGVELCASDRAIGAFGAVLVGIVDIVWASDVYSEIDPRTGRRFCSSYAIPTQAKPEWYEGDESLVPALQKGAQGDFEKFAFAQCKYKPASRRYTEAFMRGSGLVAIWVKSWADKRTVAAAKSIARRHGVPLLVVEGKDRIWVALERLNMPLEADEPVAPATTMAHAFWAAGVAK